MVKTKEVAAATISPTVPNESMNQRRAFTLMEMLLVLAIMVIVASMTLPALRGPMENQRLRKAGDVIRAEWAKARVSAMKTGRIHVFQYQTDGTGFGVEPWYAADDDQTSTNDSSGKGGNATALRITQPLPDNISFAGGDTTSDSRSLHLENNMGGASGKAARPILFYPDGTSSTARVVLANRRQAFVVVSLRGLTGIAQVSDLLSADEVPQ